MWLVWCGLVDVVGFIILLNSPPNTREVQFVVLTNIASMSVKQKVCVRVTSEKIMISFELSPQSRS